MECCCKSLDTNHSSNIYRNRSRGRIQESTERCDVVDIFRSLYPNIRKYTWRRLNGTQRSKLDYFVVSWRKLRSTLKAPLADGKKLSGKGRLTEDQVNSIHKFYGDVIRGNKHNLVKMREAFFFFFFSFPQRFHR